MSTGRGCFVVLLLALGLASPARAALHPTLSGHVPEATKTSLPLGHLAETNQLSLSIGLPLQHQDELTALLRNLYTPGHPDYQKYLTPDEFARRFGPSEADYQALIQFAESNHLTVVSKYGNRVVLSVKGTAAAVEKAFHVQLLEYQHPTEGRSFFAPDREPTLELATPVLHIAGLDNLVVPHPASLARHGTPASDGTDQPQPMSGSGTGGSFWGKDFRAAYNTGASLTGAGQNVGLLEFDGYYTADISAYTNLARINATNALINVLIDNATGAAGKNNVEVALDIEMVMAMAPGVSAILVYEGGGGGNGGDDILARMATDNLAKQLSASWTFATSATTEQLFQQLVAQGQTYFNASGDSDAYLGAPSSPSDDPYVVSVGGTTLTTTTASGPWTSETTWNWNNDKGSSGGTSLKFNIPWWQTNIDMSTNLGSTAFRNLPDVSLTADNVWVTYGNGVSESVGGTSVAAPLWAAVTAMINQQATTYGRPPIGFINPAIYAICQGAGYATNFHDIVTGNNTNSISPTMFYATPGYDLCTGWGTPIVQNLVNTLVPKPLSPFIIFSNTPTLASESCLPANHAIDPGEFVSLNVTLRNIGSFATTNLLATVVESQQVHYTNNPVSYGSISAGGTINRTHTLSFIANGECGGSLPVQIHLTDGSADFGTFTYTYTLGAPNQVLTQKFDTVTTPALPTNWVSAASGGAVNWATTHDTSDSSPNSAFAYEGTSPGIAELLSPSVPISSANALLTFRSNYNLEADPSDTNRAYDGAVLEMSVNNGPFLDILDAGGSFALSGYNRTINSDTTNDPTGVNPLNGRPCWSGVTLGFITTVVKLPPTVAGQSVQFKWRLAIDNGNFYGGLGWYIDSVVVQDGYNCCSPPAPPVIVSQPVDTSVPAGGTASFSVGATGSPTPTYQWAFDGTNVVGATASSLVLTNVGISQAGSYQVVLTNASGSVTSSVALLHVLPPTVSLTNFTINNTGVSLSVKTVAGYSYQLEYKNSLSDTNWTPALPEVPGTDGVLIFEDPNPANTPSRFYRVRVR